ncbi:hypothetical protein, partial [Pectobacterium punjabense]|uniref:hypothetical protein n=1 Tax=Pectobacterium punjabense TaxID=2108399 RepID=UPI00197E85D8
NYFKIISLLWFISFFVDGAKMLQITNIYPSYFKLHVRWLRSLTRITYLSKLIGIPSLAAFLKLELFRL